MLKHGKELLAEDVAPTGMQGSLRTIFCDGADERRTVSLAQQCVKDDDNPPAYETFKFNVS